VTIFAATMAVPLQLETGMGVIQEQTAGLVCSAVVKLCRSSPPGAASAAESRVV
jgi:hypothetical protein